MEQLVIPQIYTEVLTEKLKGRIKVAQMARALELEAFRTEGDTVHFPCFQNIGDAEVVTKRKGLVGEELKQIDSTAIVQHLGKAVRVYDIDARTGKGDFIENATFQHARIFAKALDLALIKEASNTTLKAATADTKAVTSAEMENAMNLFGDEQDAEDFAGIVIHSLVAPSFRKMEEFVSTGNTMATPANGIQRNGGYIGNYRGIPIFTSDSCMDGSECLTLIIKKDALSYMLKKDFNVEEERESKLFATDIVSDMMFAVKQTMVDGIVCLRKTITTK